MAPAPFTPLPGFASPEIALLASCLQDATNEWREELGKIDTDGMIWQPFPGGHSVGALILHMADAEAWWFESVAAGKSRPRGEAKLLLSEETKQYGVNWPTPPREPLEWYLAIADDIRARSLSTLARFEDPDRMIQRKSWKHGLNIRWIVAHVAGHEAYHGGQAVLLKLMRKKLA